MSAQGPSVERERAGKVCGCVGQWGPFGQGNAGSRPLAAAHVLSGSSLSLCACGQSLVDALIMRGGTYVMRYEGERESVCFAGVVIGTDS